MMEVHRIKRLTADIANQGNKSSNTMLKNTPVDEITAGNRTCSLAKDALKYILCEVKKSTRLHNGLMSELMLTPKVNRDSRSERKPLLC